MNHYRITYLKLPSFNLFLLSHSIILSLLCAGLPPSINYNEKFLQFWTSLSSLSSLLTYWMSSYSFVDSIFHLNKKQKKKKKWNKSFSFYLQYIIIFFFAVALFLCQTNERKLLIYLLSAFELQKEKLISCCWFAE